LAIQSKRKKMDEARLRCTTILHRMISTRKSKTFFAKVRDLAALLLADEQRQ
jgi:hypothetical protein